MILALVGQKGGSGKTTTSVHLATFLALSYRVLLVDADPQASAITFYEDAVQNGYADRLPTVVQIKNNLHRPEQVPKLAAAHDFTIIDTPPGIQEGTDNGRVQRSALMVADLAVLPCSASSLETNALAKSIALIQEAREYRPNLKAGILINRHRPGTKVSKGLRDVLAQTGEHVFSTVLGLRQAYADAIAAGVGVTTYAPRDPAAKEVVALATELLSFGGIHAETRTAAHRKSA